MTALAPTLEVFFTERLIHQRQASPNTIAAYRDAWRLLLGYAQQHTGKQPYQLDLGDLDAELVSHFLAHLETERHNSVRTRNARLAAIRCFFRFAALRHPEHAARIARVLDIPTKRCDRAVVSYLDDPRRGSRGGPALPASTLTTLQPALVPSRDVKIRSANRFDGLDSKSCR